MKKILFLVAAAIVLIAVFAWLYFGFNNDMDNMGNSEANVSETMEKHIEYIYEIPADSFEVVKGVIGRNQMLGNILNDYGVTNKQIFEISNLPADQFNERKIKAGNKYALFIEKDSAKQVAFFVYEKDQVNYVVLHFEDSIHVEQKAKPVTVKQEEVSGEITSSLWESFLDMGANPFLAVELSEIYAWSIDFFGLQEGDKFRVIYDELYVDTNSVGISTIYGAWFHHSGHEFWAIPFVQDSIRAFFDEEGNSLRKAFLKAPLRFSRISSRFSNARMHPILKIRRPHHGVDYAAPIGTPVHAIGDGQVFARAYQRGGGNYVKIKHNSVYSTTYMHLSGFGKGIKVGSYVKQGDVIGYVGSTGLSTGPHLDFRFYKNGQAIDPLKVKAPPVEPVHDSLKVDYDLVMNSMMKALREI